MAKKFKVYKEGYYLDGVRASHSVRIKQSKHVYAVVAYCFNSEDAEFIAKKLNERKNDRPAH